MEMTIKRQRSSFLYALFIVVVMLCAVALRAETPMDSQPESNPEDSTQGIKEKTQAMKLRFLLGPGFVTIKNGNGYVSGASGQGAFLISLSDRWQTGFGMAQAFTFKPFTTFYTSLDIRIGFALTGSFLLRTRTANIGEKEVSVSQDSNVGGLRVHGMFTQYFLKLGSPTSFPYAGFGGSLTYDLPSSGLFNYYLGLRMDRISAMGAAAYPIQTFVGIALWL